ncbi:MAG: hypothetical protein WC483_05470 [Candidatus Paceibacterota bacterium]
MLWAIIKLLELAVKRLPDGFVKKVVVALLWFLKKLLGKRAV